MVNESVEQFKKSQIPLSVTMFQKDQFNNQFFGCHEGFNRIHLILLLNF